MSAPPIPLVLLFGPSGVGKTTLADHLSKVLNWRHLDTDLPPPGSTHRAQRRNFGAMFAAPGGLVALAAELRQCAAAAGSEGVVQSFVSTVYLRSDQMAGARSAGLSRIYLWGGEEECLESFLSREAETGRNLGADHWRKYNSAIYRHLIEPACQPQRIDAFRGGRRRPLEDLVAEVQLRCVS